MILSIYIPDNPSFFQDIDNDFNINKDYTFIYFDFNISKNEVYIILDYEHYVVQGNDCPVIKLFKIYNNDLKIIFFKKDIDTYNYIYEKNQGLKNNKGNIQTLLLNLEIIQQSLQNNEKKPYLKIIYYFLENPSNQYKFTEYKELLFSYYIKLKNIYDYFKNILINVGTEKTKFSLLSDNGDFLRFIQEKNFNTINTNENEFPNIILDNYLKWKKTIQKKQILVLCSSENSYNYYNDFYQYIDKISNIIGEKKENWNIHYLPGSMKFLTNRRKKNENKNVRDIIEFDMDIRIRDRYTTEYTISQKFPDDIPMYESFFDLIFFAGCNSFRYLFREEDFEKNRNPDIFNSILPSEFIIDYKDSLVSLKTILKDDGKIMFQENNQFVRIDEIPNYDKEKDENIIDLFHQYFIFHTNEK